ncbi:MAG: formylmethanofuran--tetrahydromethanopterin N-formyltransferase [Theionarchaea archaeon]|nr:formylmethanofuran--tetrahydromethanopterin N-formyltransferase [Theionarchaea archaeon]
MVLKVNGVEVEDTYCEAFQGLYTRLLVTAGDEKRLRRAVAAATSLPCTVFGESEGGIEAWVDSGETPDGRRGAVIQIWIGRPRSEKCPECGHSWKLFGGTAGTLEFEASKRIRQGILVVPTTRIFNYMEGGKQMGMMDRVGHCGDGYEWVEERFGRRMINIPLMMGEFLIEERVGYDSGVMGGNIWFMCDSTDSAIEAGDAAIDALNEMDGVITSFDICSAGSKVETNFPEIGPTTNHPYCPTLRGRVDGLRVPEGVESIPEIVINGTTLDRVGDAMALALQSGSRVDGVLRMSAGNYGGKLGKYKIYLRDIL